MKLIALVCIIATLVVPPLKAQQPSDVTLVRLIANPDKFDGKLIRVIGFLRIEFEGNVLYLHREDYENAILGNGIWVDVTPAIMKKKANLNMNYVLLEGVFSSSERGHMDMWSGTIKQIRRSQLWAPLNNVPRVGKQSK
jgi:hypothetical protein